MQGLKEMDQEKLQKISKYCKEIGYINDSNQFSEEFKQAEIKI